MRAQVNGSRAYAQIVCHRLVCRLAGVRCSSSARSVPAVSWWDCKRIPPEVRVERGMATCVAAGDLVVPGGS